MQDKLRNSTLAATLIVLASLGGCGGGSDADTQAGVNAGTSVTDTNIETNTGTTSADADEIIEDINLFPVTNVDIHNDDDAGDEEDETVGADTAVALADNPVAQDVVIQPVASQPQGNRVRLSADGRSDTYGLIDSRLGGDAVEAPDCGHRQFGKHITQKFDKDLGRSVFVFHLHVDHDDDRCIKKDRQRIEIKVYDKSPAFLKGTKGDTVKYRWKFKLDDGFKPSTGFTHIHQIKANNSIGVNAQPLITLTPRISRPDRMDVLHVNSAGSRSVLASTQLAPLTGTWVEAYEKITYGSKGSYTLVLRRVSDGKKILSFNKDNIDMWRPNTSFMRPKWGLYRSLNQAHLLRDEQVRFNDFCLSKAPDGC